MTSVHAPWDTRIFHKECRSAAAAGYEVWLVTAQGEEGESDGVRILRVPTPHSRWRRMVVTTWRIYRQAVTVGADLYQFHDPELIPVGILLKLGGERVIYDVHEDVPRDILDKTYLAGWVRRPIALMAAFFEWLAGRFLDGMVVATPEIARRFSSHKTVVVRNFPRVGEESCREVREQQAVYVGGLGERRGLRQMVAAMARLPADWSVRLVLIGECHPPALLDEVSRDPGFRRVVVAGWQNQEAVARWLGRSWLGLVVLAPTTCYQVSLPTKLFEYMAAGLPVIASDFPLWRRMVDGAGCGVLVDPEDPAALAVAMEWLFTHPEEARAMGERGRQAVREHYSWSTEERELLAFYRSLMSDPPHPPALRNCVMFRERIG